MNTTQVDFKLLIEPWIKINKSYLIKGLTINSQDVKKDFLFIAINGEKHTSNDFIKDAIKNGATCILKETNKNTPVYRGLKRMKEREQIVQEGMIHSMIIVAILLL